MIYSCGNKIIIIIKAAAAACTAAGRGFWHLTRASFAQENYAWMRGNTDDDIIIDQRARLA